LIIEPTFASFINLVSVYSLGDILGCSNMCRGVKGLLMLIVGAVLFMNLSVAGLTALQLAGLLFILMGLIKLVHCAGMCPSCKADK
jgi:uncharacterized membrane protein HdeD (DUF308 family)